MILEFVLAESSREITPVIGAPLQLECKGAGEHCFGEEHYASNASSQFSPRK